TCQCAPGFTGVNCEVNIDDCVGNPCKNGGTCVDGANSFTCVCPPGFTGALCEINIDECLGDPCGPNASCVDGVNSFQCSCNAGHGNCDGTFANGCEVDFATNGSHCGACGHTCGGGACVAGVCQVVEIPKAVDTGIQFFTTDRGFLYYATTNNGDVKIVS